MRKALAPQRRLRCGRCGGRPAARRDVYDHLIRICDLIDGYRDLLSGAIDVYLSMASNRVDGVMKQLAVIATIFLSLS